MSETLAPVVVEIENLSSGFRVAGRTSYVHRNLDLRIAQGELLSIVGGSGSGKTTLLRQMLGLERPLRGRVQVLGAPASELAAPGAAAPTRAKP